MPILATLVSGLLLGTGLVVSGMIDPMKVLNFLDFAAIGSGGWDGSLAFVLGGAVVVAFIGVQVMKRMRHPAFDDSFHVPTSRRIDAPLIIGSALFGLGWGIGGFCPGPAVASLSMGIPQTVLFVVAMLVGMTLHDRVWSRRT